MRLSVRIGGEGRPAIWLGSRPWVHGLGVSIPIGGAWYRDGEGLTAGPWNVRESADAWGSFQEFRRTYALGEAPLLALTLRADGKALLVRAELLRDLAGIRTADSFEEPTFLAPTFSFPGDLKFFLTTFGLGPSTAGGYWPTAMVGEGPDELPTEAFAPLVLFSGEGALAIAPGNWFLTSPLVRVRGGAARGLSGAVEALPAGFRMDTWFVAGEDPLSALTNLGDRLLTQGGKIRPQPSDHPLLSTLGYWNAYGSYYTEFLRPMNGAILEDLALSFRRDGLPVGYFGLDLWYPYREIGRASCFRPDPGKYPHGLAETSARTGLPYVLHLSALAEDNTYGADGTQPDVYRTIAREVKGERAIAVWHDWLRTWQHLTPALRTEPEAAERWFSGMAEAFRAEGLPVLLCMHTMGMALAATQEPNVIAARSHTDYLFAQQGAVDQAARAGHGGFRHEQVSPMRLWRQNLLMGAALWTLGLAPFHDLFLTRPHPGFGGDRPTEDAVLRALSCGPVGFGDGLGMTDAALLRRLLLPDGTLAQPDRPPFPVMESLNSDLQAFWTLRQAGDAAWVYYLVLNTGQEPLSFRFDPPLAGEFLVWDVLRSRVASGMSGRLAPGRLAYFVLAPLRQGIAPLGLADKFVPAPAGRILTAEWNRGWRILVQGVGSPFAVFARQPIGVQCTGRRQVHLWRKNGLWLCEIEDRALELLISRR